MSDGFRWTPAQQRAISLVGRSVVVGAAAGSGKTAVLAARAVELVTTGGVNSDGKAGRPCGVSQLLVATFTNAAANEMRQRIAARLGDAIAVAEPKQRQRLRSELDRLPAATIGTLSSIAGQLVRRHDAKVGVDPHFAVLPDEQAQTLRLDAAQAAIEDGLGEDEATAALLDELVDGDLPRLARLLVDVHGRVWSLPDPQQWQTETTAALAELVNADWSSSSLATLMTRVVRREKPDHPAHAATAPEPHAAAASEPNRE
ncbi:MAG: UvrD-helicase domain-containing protein, partial [Planctomycetota bacterium]